MGDETPRSESGAVLVEYGMILLGVVLVVFALVGVLGGLVASMFDAMLDGF